MKLKFENFWRGFPLQDNIVTVALRSLGDVEIVNDNPDVIIRQGSDPIVRSGALGISWFVESMNRIGEPNYSHCDYSLNSCNFNDKRNHRIPFWSTQINWNDAPKFDINRGPTYYLSTEELYKPRITENFSSRRPCSSVASGTLGKRQQFYPMLSNSLEVVHGGAFLKNTNELIKKPGNSDYLEKIQFISKFKTNLCFENDDRAGYVCEKILHSFVAGCVPIYWGPRNVNEDINKDSFVDVSNFESDEQAIQYIVDLVNDDLALQQFLEQPIFPDGLIPYHASPEALADFFKGIL